MVFALAKDDRTLKVFATEADAISYCEGIDVEEGGWLFFANDGLPLEPHFSHPSRRGTWTVTSGIYSLRPSSIRVNPTLRDRLHEVVSVDGIPGISTIADVERLLTAGSSGDAPKTARA
jgi:hypothetical protein